MSYVYTFFRFDATHVHLWSVWSCGNFGIVRHVSKWLTYIAWKNIISLLVYPNLTATIATFGHHKKLLAADGGILHVQRMSWSVIPMKVTFDCCDESLPELIRKVGGCILVGVFAKNIKEQSYFNIIDIYVTIYIIIYIYIQYINVYNIYIYI